MVHVVIKALVSIMKGKGRGEGIGGSHNTCQVNKATAVTKVPCQVNNTVTVTMLPCQVDFTTLVTASKKYAMFRDMCEGK